MPKQHQHQQQSKDEEGSSLRARQGTTPTERHTPIIEDKTAVAINARMVRALDEWAEAEWALMTAPDLIDGILRSWLYDQEMTAHGESEWLDEPPAPPTAMPKPPAPHYAILGNTEGPGWLAVHVDDWHGRPWTLTPLRTPRDDTTGLTHIAVYPARADAITATWDDQAEAEEMRDREPSEPATVESDDGGAHPRLHP